MKRRGILVVLFLMLTLGVTVHLLTREVVLPGRAIEGRGPRASGDSSTMTADSAGPAAQDGLRLRSRADAQSYVTLHPVDESTSERILVFRIETRDGVLLFETEHGEDWRVSLGDDQLRERCKSGVRVRSGGYLPRHIPSDAIFAPGTHQVKLRRTGAIEIVVVDSVTGRGVPGVRLELIPARMDELVAAMHVRDAVDSRLALAQTRPDVLEPAQNLMKVFPLDEVPWRVETSVEGRAAWTALPAGTSYRWRLLEGPILHVKPPHEDAGIWKGNLRKSTVADNESGAIGVAPGERVQVQVQSLGSTRIHGRLSPETRPFGSTSIRVVRHRAFTQPRGPFTTKLPLGDLTADANGSFEIRGLAFGLYEIVFVQEKAPNRFDVHYEMVDLEAGGPEVDLGIITFGGPEQGFVLNVSDQQSRVLSDPASLPDTLTFDLHHRGVHSDPRSPRLGCRLEIDPRDRFVVTGLEPGRYFLMGELFQPLALQQESVVVPQSGDISVRVAMHPNTVVQTLRLRLPRPVEAPTTLEVHVGSGSVWERRRLQVDSGTQERAFTTALGVGECRVVCTDTGATSYFADVRFEVAQNPAPQDVALETAGVLVIPSVAAGAMSAAGAFVNLSLADCAPEVLWSVPADSRADREIYGVPLDRPLVWIDGGQAVPVTVAFDGGRAILSLR